MKKSNVLAALTVAGLAAATAVPAMALENEFHGMFSARYINSNFNGTPTGAGYYTPGVSAVDLAAAPTATAKTKKQSSANFIEQRARLQYIAKANADLKLVTHFELDYEYWGNSSHTVGRNSGGAIGADSVNFETKNIYLDANVTKSLNMKLGMMPNNDAFKGILFDADMAGVLLSSSYGKFSPSFGAFRFNDSGVGTLGKKTADMIMLDGKFAVTKDLKVGAAYYLFHDNSIVGTDVKMNVLGVNAEYTSGPLTLNGFAVYETGVKNKTYVNAFAANVGAKIKAGPGTARCEVLYVSGSDDRGKNAFYAVDGENGYYDNEMAIIGRDKNAYTTDNSVVFNSGNKGQGQVGAFLGYDLPINAKLDTAFNLGFVGVAHSNSNKPLIYTNGVQTTNTNSSNFLGAELNAEATYKLLEGLSVSTRVAYAMLGDYYKNVATNGTPVNPYDFKLIFKYSF